MLSNMPVYSDPRETDAIARIVKEIRESHIGLCCEDLVGIVSLEAQRHGIKPSISAPIVKKIFDEKDIFVP